MGRITDGALKAEHQFLTLKPAFELPYGRAWFLLLLFELRKRSSWSAVGRKIHEEIAQAVIDWMERSPYPELQNDGKAQFVATHDSWLFTYLLVVLSGELPNPLRDRFRLLQKKMEGPRSQLMAMKHRPDDFLYLPAVQAMIDRVGSAVATKPARYPVQVSPPLFDPPLNSHNAHNPGAEMVRIWPHAIDSQKDERARSRFHTRMNEMFSRKDQWADSFELVSHWVPQFMWMGMWLEAGRP
jgi:hypothetical protein